MTVEALSKIQKEDPAFNSSSDGGASEQNQYQVPPVSVGCKADQKPCKRKGENTLMDRFYLTKMKNLMGHKLRVCMSGSVYVYLLLASVKQRNYSTSIELGMG